MFFKHVYDETLAQGSYVIGCQATGEAIVIDAQRDIDVYLEIAKKNNLTIKYITETHIHADYLCGSRELATVTGAEMYLSDEGGEGWLYEFAHKGLKDGDVIKVGNLTLDVMHTPGHTPESISFILTDHPASSQPVMAFTGDFVFVGDIGRPDLLEEAAGIVGTKRIGAEQMYDSIQRFAKLPDHIQVWPAHGAGSACGKSLGAVPSSTIGYEKISNWAFQYKNDKEGFIDYLLMDQPEPPRYFAMMKYLNKVDRPLRVQVPQIPQLTTNQFLTAFNNGLKVIDTREKEDYLQLHIPNTINITGNKSFSTWCGWHLDYQEQFVLICKTEKIEELTRKLMRVGLDTNMYGFITESQMIEVSSELGFISADIVTAEEVKDKLNNNNTQILDVRNDVEFKSGHIANATHVFVGNLLKNLDKISKSKEVIIYCHSGQRAANAYSILAKAGFNNLKVFVGGSAQWSELGYEVKTEEVVLA
ncbi:MAG: MBL fold metallo-hydrolase [Brumimicrobium sp.]